MAKDKEPTMNDLYMQFAALSVILNGTNAQTLVEAMIHTGLSIRGGLAWLIHQVEVFCPVGTLAGAEELYVAVAGIPSLGAMPELNDKGVLVRVTDAHTMVTNGMSQQYMPWVRHFLPPVPYAGPKMCVYARTRDDEAPYRGLVVRARICFTTVPIDSKMYAELAETWAA